MELMNQLQFLKAKSITYRFNNLKIQKHISIQKRKESILQTVENLKIKLRNWRQFKIHAIEGSYIPPDLMIKNKKTIVEQVNEEDEK